MHIPAPLACLWTGVITLGTLAALDLTLWSLQQPLPPAQLHHLVADIGAVLAGAGLIGAHMRESVALGRKLERERHQPRSAQVVPLPSPRRPGGHVGG